MAITVGKGWNVSPGTYYSPVEKKTMARQSTAGGGSTDYRSILSQLVESLKPGGEIEKTYIDDAVQEGKQLGAQLNAASISKGLGNATNNAPVTVAKHVAKRKSEIRSGLLQQFLGSLQFLANMGFQEEQNTANRAVQSGTSNASRGLDVFGQPFMSLGGGNTGGFSAQAFPSLASAGGMGGSYSEPPSLFGNSGGSSSSYSSPSVKFDDVMWGANEDISDLADKYTFDESLAKQRKW